MPKMGRREPELNYYMALEGRRLSRRREVQRGIDEGTPYRTADGVPGLP